MSDANSIQRAVIEQLANDPNKRIWMAAQDLGNALGLWDDPLEPHSDHENHETLRQGCDACETEINDGMARYYLPSASRWYPEALEGMTLNARRFW